MASPFVTHAPALETSSVDKNQTLYGLRLAVKDLFHVAGEATSAGNPDWLKSHDIPQQTHSSVLKLLSLGARYVGKTVTDELAYSLNGQNIHYGTPSNPSNPDRLPGGSSSGSAVAVASNQADIGLGTDTGGSIRVPSSYNGLYGMRPSHGVIATDNMVALAPSFDTVGIMSKELAVLEDVMTAIIQISDEYQTKSKVGDARIKADITNVKFGVVDAFVDSAQHRDQINTWLSKLSDKNIACSSIDIDLNLYPLSDTFKVLQGAEIWQQHGNWLTEQQPNIAPDIKSRFDWCSTITAEQVKAAKISQNAFCVYLAKTFENIDFILLPTTPGIAPLLNASADSLAEYRNTLLNLTAFAGLAGLPQIHLPKFIYNDAPCGVSIIGPKHSDITLMKMAQLLDGIK